MRVHVSCTTTLHVAVKTEHVCRSRHHYMRFTSQRFAVGIHIPRRRVVLEVGFYTTVWQGLNWCSLFDQISLEMLLRKSLYLIHTQKNKAETFHNYKHLVMNWPLFNCPIAISEPLPAMHTQTYHYNWKHY